MSFCSNKNEVFQNFNLMNDARAFTDYRSAVETYTDIEQKSSQYCSSNTNSYDTRICLQRNAGLIFSQDSISFSKKYNLPRCSQNQPKNVLNNKNKNNNNLINTAMKKNLNNNNRLAEGVNNRLELARNNVKEQTSNNTCYKLPPNVNN